MESLLPSPAIAIVGRHNSGKTTLVEKLISQLVQRGLDVGSIKHHSHSGFEIDIPGKDSYRHRQAGASETVISSPGQMALVKTIEGELECSQLVERMPGHDIVIVEGYRKSGLATIEVMRAGNPADEEVAAAFLEAAQRGDDLTTDFVQLGRARQQGMVWGTRSADGVEVHAAASSNDLAHSDNIQNKMPTAHTLAVVTDIPAAAQAAALYQLECFGLNDITKLCDFLVQRVARPRISLVIQAGGQSKRMGQSKATVSFGGRPLISRIVERMLPVADEMIITTNEAEQLAFLTKEFPQASLRLVPDVLDERGALPGLLTALSAASYDYVALVACDMVNASARLIAAESIELHLSQADCVVPVNQHGYEPFQAVYYRPAILPALKQALAAGEKRMQDVFAKVNLESFPQARVKQVEPAGGCFVNVNTPEELAAAERNFLED